MVTVQQSEGYFGRRPASLAGKMEEINQLDDGTKEGDNFLQLKKRKKYVNLARIHCDIKQHISRAAFLVSVCGVGWGLLKVTERRIYETHPFKVYTNQKLFNIQENRKILHHEDCIHSKKMGTLDCLNNWVTCMILTDIRTCNQRTFSYN